MLFTKFNKQISLPVNLRKKRNEEFFFNCLKEVLASDFHAAILHGSTGMVYFDVPGSIPGTQKRCEISDLLIVVIGERQIRYTLLQNKTKHKDTYSPFNAMSLSVRQHHLLSSKPVVTPAGKSPYLYPDILSSAILDSVGSFGIFYSKGVADVTGKQLYDMSYMIANRIHFVTTLKTDDYNKNKRLKAEFLGKPDNIVSLNEYEEVEGCDGLDKFEAYLKKMKIGTPVTLSGNNENLQLIKLINYKIDNELEVQERDKAVIKEFKSLYKKFRVELSGEDLVDIKSRRYPDILLIKASNN